jgi:integrase
MDKACKVLWVAWHTLARRTPYPRLVITKAGCTPKIVQERLGHGSIQITLDTYSHVAPGLQQAAANRFDDIVLPKESAHKK